MLSINMHCTRVQNSNVVKFYSMLKKDIEDEQLCYYQTGIGTYENPGIMSPLALWVAKVMDEAIAWCVTLILISLGINSIFALH